MAVVILSSLIKVRGLNKTYSRGGEKIQVLQGLIWMSTRATLSLHGRADRQDDLAEFTRWAGRALGGEHYVDGDEVTHMSASKLRRWRRAARGLHLPMFI